MGINTLTTRVDGNTIPAADHNELVEALRINFVPRNNSNSPEDIIGQLGQSNLRWLRAFVQEYFVGDAANNLKIYEGAAGELWIERNSSSDEIIKLIDNGVEFWVNGVQVLRFGETELEAAPNGYIKKGAIENQRIAVSVFDTGASNSSWQTLTTLVLNDCLAGKQILIDYSCAAVAFPSNANGLDTRIVINGGAVATWTALRSSENATEFISVSRKYLYTIPSDGTYTIQIQFQDYSELRNGSALAEEK